MSLIRLLAFADNDVTSDAEEVNAAMLKVENVSAYMFVGDGPYSESGTEWTGMMDKSFGDKKDKLIFSRGNHDEDESESKQTQEDIESWYPAAKGIGFADTWLTSKQLGNVFIISMDTQDLDIEFKRDQYTFVENQLKKAKELRAQGQVDWIVVLFHKPFFTLKSSHSPYTAVRFMYREIFRDAQVDFCISGHNHNTQLWLPMIPSDSEANGEGQQLFTMSSDNKTFDFAKDHGQLFIVSGHAGHEWNKINDSGAGVKNVMHHRSAGDFGFTQLDFDGKKANVKSIDTTGKVHYEYNVTREGSGTVEPPKPCDEPNMCIDQITNECRLLAANEEKDPTTKKCKVKVPPIDPPVEGDVVCPQDYEYDPSLGHCIPTLTPQIGPKCPTGYKWNPTKKICEKDSTTPPPPPCLQGECKDPNTGQCRPINSETEIKDSAGFCRPKPIVVCPDNQCKDVQTGQCRSIGPNEEKDVNGFCKLKSTDPQTGEIDEHGIKWLAATGKQETIKQTRDTADDDRWSGNVTGLKLGMEATMIAKSEGVASDGHFAMKHGGGNHSGGNASKQRWYDTGLRKNGEVQLQWEGPHPSNHSFSLPDPKQFIKTISKNLDGNYYIGLKWIVQAMTPDASPSKGGIRCRMYVDKDAVGPDGKPKNNWELVYDFIDGVDAQVLNPQSYVLPDEWDCEVRKSGTQKHTIVGGGLHVRALGDGNPNPNPDPDPDPDPDPEPQPCPEGQHRDPTTGQCVPDTNPDPDPDPTPSGEVLWDSNVHLKTGQAYTITDTHGSQSANGKGVFMAASGNPRLKVDADGTFHLEADAGHGRVYIKATNFNARMEGEVKIETDSIDNTTWRLRSRHGESGDCENRFGGFGATCERNAAEYQTELCHNEHENSISKALTKPITVGQWFKFRYSCCNNANNTKVLFKTEYDYNDGNGFVVVATGEHASPKPYYMDEATFNQESYSWIRINNESTGSVAYKNVKIIKMKAGDLG